MNIDFPPSFTEAHTEAITRYLNDSQTLNSNQWLVALEGFDILGEAAVTIGGNQNRFKELYSRLIDLEYADGFLSQLWDFAQPEPQGTQLKASIARQIFTDLSDSGYYDPKSPDSQFLLAYCFYWWDAFAKGYIFEAVIFKDLTDSGIQFTPHDFRDSRQRFSRSDLILSGFRGDLKTSSYFLHSPRTNILTNDFYITRLFDTDNVKWVSVVLMQERFYEVINGDTTVCNLKTCFSVLPSPARVTAFQCELIVLLYQEFKQRVLTRQQKGIL
jgi:hypothetical protein